jgi:hypothetical protein
MRVSHPERAPRWDLLQIEVEVVLQLRPQIGCRLKHFFKRLRVGRAGMLLWSQNLCTRPTPMPRVSVPGVIAKPEYAVPASV